MTLEKAIKLRSEGKLEESNKILLKLVGENPDDAMINYQCAWSFDVLEKETEAIEYYEKAIALGLPDEDLKEAYLGLGSTYRTIGEYDKSKKTFEVAMKKFNDKSLKVFYSMTLYNLENHSESMNILLKLLAETSNDNTINDYRRAIEFYSDKLDQVFK
jgi:tetratricopeptide (TPR) repeat protein